MNPNERQATLNGLIWGAALWEMPFLYAATLFLANVLKHTALEMPCSAPKMAISLRLELARIIHECCRALACSFARNEFLISRPYAWLRPSSSESVASKGPAQSSRRFMNSAG